MRKSYFTKLFSFLLLLTLFIPQSSFALTNGILATDLLGQYDQTSFTDPVPIYTKGGANDGANKYGFNFTGGGIGGGEIDTVNHRYFQVDPGNNRVLVYNLNTNNTFPDRIPDYVLGQTNFYSNTAANTQAGMSSPSDLAYDNVNNRLFVVQLSQARVTVYDVSSITNGEDAIYVLGQVDFISSSSANTQAGMNAARGIAYDSVNSRLFVSQTGNNRVTVYNLSSGITNGMNASNVLGQANFTATAAANTQAGLNFPLGMGYDPTNQLLFVAQASSNRVSVFDVTSITDGENAINVLGQANFTATAAANTQAGLNFPEDAVYDDTNDRLFVVGQNNNRITVYNLGDGITDGENAINVLGQANFTATTAATTQSGLSAPRSVAYDPTNQTLFVVEYTNQRITMFNVAAITDGEAAVDALGQYDQTSFTNPVPVYTKGGANDGPNKFGFNDPAYIALDSIHHRLFISDYANNRILVFNLNSNNTFIDKIPDYVLGQPNFYTNTATTTQAGTNAPGGIAYDSVNDRLFSVNQNNHRVVVYDVASISNGEPAVNVLGQANFTSSGAATTQAGMNNPTGLAYDITNERLFVAEMTNNRVLVYDVASITDGENAINVLGQANFTSSGAATTQAGMNAPRGIYYDMMSNQLFVADAGNHRVTAYNVSSITDGENAISVLGQPDFITATANTTQAGMNSPRGIAYDVNSNVLYVSQNGNNRVTSYDIIDISNGENAINVIGQPDFVTGTAVTTQAGLNTPRALLYDSINNKLFVLQSTGSNRISIFSLSTPISQVTTNSSGPLTVGSSVTINITFSNSVTVTGTPTLELETGDTDRLATYTSGSGTNTLAFTYVIQQGDITSDLSYKSTTSLSLNGGTIIDSTNNNEATLTLPTPGASGSLSLTSNVEIVQPASVILPSGGGSYTPTYVTTVTIPTTTEPVVINPLLGCTPGDLYSALTGLPCNTNLTNPNNTQTTLTCPTIPSIPILLKLNMTHSSIKLLQQYLNCKGYTVSTTGAGSLNNETNYFGSLTYNAVKAFQKDHNLTVDGVVGPNTRGEMGK